MNAQHPELLRTNINSTCFKFTTYVLEELKKIGVSAYSVCKTAGEGQYTPPGFAPRVVTGLDGKPYNITGVSHDAIWADGVIVDTVGKGNDSQDPIFEPDGSPMFGIPVWNEIPPQFWRPNNPPLKDGSTPVPQSTPTVPGYEEIGGDAFFRKNVGVPLVADMALAGQFLNEGSSVWFSRTLYDILAAFMGGHQDQVGSICLKHRNEWRRILGLSELS